MAEPSETSVVIPAFNEAVGIGAVVRDLAKVETWQEILVIDDGSSDDTAARAREAGATVIRHPYNKGNGAAVKTGIRAARGTYLLVLDGDGQHRPEDAPRLLRRLGEYDLVIGARPASTQATTGRRLGNALLNRLASWLTAFPIEDLTSGFRTARTAHFREFVHMLPNGFSTPATTTLAFLRAGYNVAFEATAARPRQGISKIRFVRDGAKMLLIVVRVITIFSPLRVFIPVSLSSLAGGVGYAVWTIATEMHVTNTSVLLTVLGVLVFLVGLVSDQIAMLRMGGRDHHRE